MQWLCVRIGQLAPIAAIRILLDFFLTREIAEDRAEIDHDLTEPERRFTAP